MPGEVAVLGAGVDDDVERAGPGGIPRARDHQIVDDAACCVEEEGISHLARLQVLISPQISGSMMAAIAAWSASTSLDSGKASEGAGPMCDTSKSPACSRVHLCSAMMPVGYCTGKE